ncbi:MAG TPA: hypothetical protein VJT31_11235 [Rugosimonospora sp.]|nr:hypothetical protein [Rugosimonospora sp.]
MGRARPRLIHNLLGSLAILAIVTGLGLGLPALNRSLPSAKPVAADRPYAVDANVTVVPPPGATVDVTRTRPAGDRGTALFLLGGVRYALVAQPFTGGLDGAAADLRRKIAAINGYQITGREVPVRTAHGVPGRQGGYASPGRVGQYTVFLSGGVSVEATIAGADPDLHAALPALQASIASIAFGDSS